MSVLTSALDLKARVFQERSLPSALENRAEAGTSTTLGHQKEFAENISQRRPSFHVTAPHGWMNDPCGLGYDPATGIYHLFFQWNPHGNVWGNISWGHATSTDLVSWEVLSQPALTPSAEYDRCGVFTGCVRPTDIHGNPGALTAVYTSVGRLPIHYTLPYVRGSESLSIAVSQDGGMRWERQDCNPILKGPPQHVKVTGWRDPCITVWTGAQQTAPETSRSGLCGFISGGIAAQTPTVFVYSVNPKNLTEWQYIGPLVDIGLNFRPSRWSGDFGVNWEVSNLMTLCDSGGVSRDFVIMGAEGRLPSQSIGEVESRDALDKRAARSQLWMSVKPSGEGNGTDKALATHVFSGIFDHGCYYAANSFWDPKASRQIVYGWITEEDLSDDLRHRQGWSSLISLPRLVRLMTLYHVKKARNSPLDSITSIEAIPESPEAVDFTVHTLGVSTDPRLEHLRQGAQTGHLADALLSSSLAAAFGNFLPLATSCWELDAEFLVGQSCARVGFDIAHTSDFKQCTTLCWDSRDETFIIHRPHIDDTAINHGRESAPHTLFTFANEHGEETEEPLRIRAFFDKSVLEVFVNDRTAISTRIYHPADRCFGLQFWAEPCESRLNDQIPSPAAVLLRADTWDGLRV
ncbi:hypothetical protein NUU61_007145 [Penicillium alfredii]|uniref:Glycoside hydrolase family 32 protein n=1 Tax=Penicillium alfredii TaxID=1506179 RepID=A0A9W9F2H7_9EURO|nr:uncharacterized protein NUU61_007145 [Penicillium alfredii]KAJ5092275.1 hypothetical protein NUU61_007145 [Penicillium alfredii]